MTCKQAIALLLMILLCVMLKPLSGHAADWTVSPYRAQLANAPADDGQGAGEDSVGTAVNSLKKNIGKGVLFSLIIPGSGQLYSGSWLRAVPWFAIEVASWAFFANYHGKGQSKTEEFESYAGPRDAPNHFYSRAYMYAEWQVATNPVLAPGGNVTTLSFTDWLDQSGPDGWNLRSASLPAPFTHDILTTDRQQYYEMIGKYLSQFGWGWEDTWTGDASTNSFNWTVTDDPSIAPDNVSTVEFDGGSPMFFHYRDLRGRFNDLLDKGNAAMEVVLVNHVLSALDAAFAVRAYNKRVTATPEPNLGDLHLKYDIRADASQNPVRMLTLSVSLD